MQNNINFINFEIQTWDIHNPPPKKKKRRPSPVTQTEHLQLHPILPLQIEHAGFGQAMSPYVTALSSKYYITYYTPVSEGPFN